MVALAEAALLSTVAQLGKCESVAETKTATGFETSPSSPDCRGLCSGWTQMHDGKALEIHIAAAKETQKLMKSRRGK